MSPRVLLWVSLTLMGVGFALLWLALFQREYVGRWRTVLLAIGTPLSIAGILLVFVTFQKAGAH